MTDFPAEIVEHHLIRREVRLSGGAASSYYIDLRAALLCPECFSSTALWYLRELEDAPGYDVVVATGHFGALLLGSLRARYQFANVSCLLWHPQADGHGVEWSGVEPPEGGRVVLVDDVATTGETMRKLREACEGRGWRVVAEIVAVRRSALSLED